MTRYSQTEVCISLPPLHYTNHDISIRCVYQTFFLDVKVVIMAYLINRVEIISCNESYPVEVGPAKWRDSCLHSTWIPVHLAGY